MKRQTFLTVPLMPMSTIGTGIISWPIDAPSFDRSRFPL